MRLWLTRLLCVGLLLTGVLGPWVEPPPAAAQGGDAVSALLDAMTVDEKVGQLFLVSFYGPSAGDGTDIYRLVTEFHVGAVLISAANDNITDTLQAPARVLTLTNELQGAAILAASRPRPPDVTTGEPAPPPYVPLFVAINHEGDGYPFTDIQSGLTDLPSDMAIGATWDLTQAEDMGRIAGTELSALGINLLLGPSLDVLETPRLEGTDLGTRVFGGDPFWVGQMGEAFIRGVHFGSGNQVGVVAKHFPGHGGSDRRPEQELPTVRKSIEDLRSFDLVPFFDVADSAPDDGRADGFLAAHIRFQGFQGNFIRLVTPPVSFDAQAFGQLLALPEIAQWRSNGGLTVSDSLGVRAVKQFFDPTERTFPSRRIVSGAFNAGNDLLLLSEFGLNPRLDQVGNIIDALAYFKQQYRSDPNFATRVDAAVSRILALKLRLYGGQFEPAANPRPTAGLNVLLRDQDDVFTVAQAAAALIFPSLDELQARAPEPPSPAHRIVFFTDVRQGQQCSVCLRYPLLDKRQLETVVLELYGPNGTGQIRPSNLQSYSFDELAAYLEGHTPEAVGDETPTPLPPAVEGAINQADWIVFAMLNVSPDVASSSAVSNFLAQRPDIVRNKKVVVFGFSAPYVLDTTDLSKLTAFYALYSHAPQFVRTAAQLLFRELTPLGAPPVSVPSINYDLNAITKPDPNRAIELYWAKATPALEGTPQPTTLQLGDAITVTTGVILDHNGHVVPDQTPVVFKVLYREEGLPDTITAATLDGVASIVLPLNREATLEISASSDPALLSSTLTIPVTQGPFSVTPIVPPTTAPTETPPPTATAVPPTATLTPTVTPTPLPPEPPPGLVDFRGFFVMCLSLAAVLVGGYRLGTHPETQKRHGVRVALAGAIGLLGLYNYFALGLPGSGLMFDVLGALAAPVVALLGGGFGLLAGWYWFVARPSPTSSHT